MYDYDSLEAFFNISYYESTLSPLGYDLHSTYDWYSSQNLLETSSEPDYFDISVDAVLEKKKIEKKKNISIFF